jgi:hypothetical protein
MSNSTMLLVLAGSTTGGTRTTSTVIAYEYHNLKKILFHFRYKYKVFSCTTGTCSTMNGGLLKVIIWARSGFDGQAKILLWGLSL